MRSGKRKMWNLYEDASRSRRAQEDLVQVDIVKSFSTSSLNAAVGVDIADNNGLFLCEVSNCDARKKEKGSQRATEPVDQ